MKIELNNSTTLVLNECPNGDVTVQHIDTDGEILAQAPLDGDAVVQSILAQIYCHGPYLADNTSSVVAPVPGDEVWAVCYQRKKNANGRLYTVKSKVEKHKVVISRVSFCRAYEDFDDAEGALCWTATGYIKNHPEFGWGVDVNLSAGNVAFAEEDADKLLAYFDAQGMKFDCNGQAIATSM